MDALIRDPNVVFAVKEHIICSSSDLEGFFSETCQNLLSMFVDTAEALSPLGDGSGDHVPSRSAQSLEEPIDIDSDSDSDRDRDSTGETDESPADSPSEEKSLESRGVKRPLDSPRGEEPPAKINPRKVSSSCVNPEGSEVAAQREIPVEQSSACGGVTPPQHQVNDFSGAPNPPAAAGPSRELAPSASAIHRPSNTPNGPAPQVNDAVPPHNQVLPDFDSLLERDSGVEDIEE